MLVAFTVEGVHLLAGKLDKDRPSPRSEEATTTIGGLTKERETANT